ncbi:MAG TPA: hypothetical protein VNA25_20265 [Phycisphaerae bacterium]|nr:hypothetical protein [Phycisphaerae bacterium]
MDALEPDDWLVTADWWEEMGNDEHAWLCRKLAKDGDVFNTQEIPDL